jgi:hypothetical protein
LREEQAQQVVNLVQQVSLRYSYGYITLNDYRVQWLDEGRAQNDHRLDIISVFVKLASKSGKLPPNLFITGVDIGQD